MYWFQNVLISNRYSKLELYYVFKDISKRNIKHMHFMTEKFKIQKDKDSFKYVIYKILKGSYT